MYYICTVSSVSVEVVNKIALLKEKKKKVFIPREATLKSSLTVA